MKILFVSKSENHSKSSIAFQVASSKFSPHAFWFFPAQTFVRIDFFDSSVGRRLAHYISDKKTLGIVRGPMHLTAHNFKSHCTHQRIPNRFYPFDFWIVTGNYSNCRHKSGYIPSGHGFVVRRSCLIFLNAGEECSMTAGIATIDGEPGLCLPVILLMVYVMTPIIRAIYSTHTIFFSGP